MESLVEGTGQVTCALFPSHIQSFARHLLCLSRKTHVSSLLGLVLDYCVAVNGGEAVAPLCMFLCRMRRPPPPCLSYLSALLLRKKDSKSQFRLLLLDGSRIGDWIRASRVQPLNFSGTTKRRRRHCWIDAMQVQPLNGIRLSCCLDALKRVLLLAPSRGASFFFSLCLHHRWKGPSRLYARRQSAATESSAWLLLLATCCCLTIFHLIMHFWREKFKGFLII